MNTRTMVDGNVNGSPTYGKVPAAKVAEAPPVTPARILDFCAAYQASALLAAGAAHRIFTHIENGARTVAEIAARAGISLRGAQALLDGLAGLGLIERDQGRYTNAKDASQFLVEDRPSSVTGLARLSIHDMPDFAQLVGAVTTGRPLGAGHEEVDHPYWLDLVPAIGRLARPVAQAIAKHAGLARAHRPSILDVGGGSGIYTLVCLEENPEATGTQIDWPNVNRIARGLAADLGLSDRFHTIDGDYHTTSFGEAAHDLAIYANIAHLESPAANAALFARIRRALKPGGTLAISDFILDGDRKGKPFTGAFHAHMLLHTSEGAVYCEPDYGAWLVEAGFVDVSFVDTETPATLIFAR